MRQEVGSRTQQRSGIYSMLRMRTVLHNKAFATRLMAWNSSTLAPMCLVTLQVGFLRPAPYRLKDRLVSPAGILALCPRNLLAFFILSQLQSAIDWIIHKHASDACCVVSRAQRANTTHWTMVSKLFMIHRSDTGCRARYVSLEQHLQRRVACTMEHMNIKTVER